MEIQKHLFRISERALKSESADFWWKAIFYVFSSMAFVFTLFLIFGHVIVLPNNTDLYKCLKPNDISIRNDSLYYVTDKQIQQTDLKEYQEKGKILVETNQCTIIQNKNYSDTDSSTLLFGYDQISMFMDQSKRDKIGFTNFTIYLKQVRPLRKILFNFDNLIINELIDNQNGIFLEQILLIKSRYAFVSHRKDEMTTMFKIKLLLKVIVSFMVISIVTSLYIYGTIVAAPAVILLLLKTCNYLRVEGLNDIFRLFPWIGVHAIIRDTSTTPIIKQSTTQICKAMLFYFLFLYMVYYSSIIWIDNKLFHSHVQYGLQQLLFGFIALSQFAAIVFMRTRTFIKYFPAFHSLLIIGLLYYGQICDYGFKRIAFNAIFSISGAFFSWMVLRLEIPAHTIWDPAHPNTPKQDRPRCGYFPIFNMGWLKNIPEEWTFMMPLFGREHFTTRELSLVDHNTHELGLALGIPQ